jgi:hypothetical protein
MNVRPQQPELERQHRARDRADGEHDRGAPGPALRERAVEPISVTQEATLGQHHEQGHRHPHHGEQDVERQRHRHLRAGGEEVGHDGLLRGAWTPAPHTAAV